MANFQDHFRAANLDHLSNATTGYHGSANHVCEVVPTPPIVKHAANIITDNIQLIADTVRAQVALALAAMTITPAKTNTNNTPRPLSYCWSHGVTCNLRHTSQSCNHRAEGHQETATTCNKEMSGSTRVCGTRPN
jgi:hypothetical protein